MTKQHKHDCVCGGGWGYVGGGGGVGGEGGQ